MANPAHSQPAPGAWLSRWVTAVLGIAALVFIAHGIVRALEQEDVEALETPLLLSVAGQLVEGPWTLYGPYGRHNTRVMIHSPLYYHLAALVASPFYRAGLDPVSAARLGGRLLSMLCMGLTLSGAYRLARLDGASRWAGCWSVFIVAALPLAGVQPYAVRPDMLGVGLQTTGILWVLSALQFNDSKGRRLTAAYVAFGLAFCVKLHFIATSIVCTGLLLAARGGAGSPESSSIEPCSWGLLSWFWSMGPRSWRREAGCRRPFSRRGSR